MYLSNWTSKNLAKRETPADQTPTRWQTYLQKLRADTQTTL